MTWKLDTLSRDTFYVQSRRIWKGQERKYYVRFPRLKVSPTGSDLETETITRHTETQTMSGRDMELEK